ncbi:MAG: ROK family transcriptional regulator [Chloroflexi bacterium]|nr:ROK family transcriptional regulator [Chloroflexota bacterium]
MELKTTADQALMREMNLSLVLRRIHNEAPLSRAQIAVETGLNKSTVSSLVEELMALDLIRETGQNSVGAGRPATLLEINRHVGGILGIELGVDFVAVALTDFLGKILWRKNASADPAYEKTLNQLFHLTQEAINASREMSLPLLGLGLATPGTVDLNEGMLIFAPNLHWHNVPLRKVFAERTGLKVFVENDANAAAVAEHLFGIARQSTDYIFVFAGVGIGGGFFLNGELYRGKNGYAGEIGHSPIMVEPIQAPCHCGNRGCWETYANQYSIIQRVQARLDVKRSSIIPALMAEQNAPLSLPLIKQAADAGDVEALGSFSEAGSALGQGLSTIINFLNPEKIILGGPLTIAAPHMLPSISSAVTRHCLPEIGKKVSVELSQFGPDASLIGAVALVVDDIMSHPTQIERR